MARYGNKSVDSFFINQHKLSSEIIRTSLHKYLVEVLEYSENDIDKLAWTSLSQDEEYVFIHYAPNQDKDISLYTFLDIVVYCADGFNPSLIITDNYVEKKRYR